MYELIAAYLNWWIARNPQRTQSHYSVKALLRVAVREGFLTILSKVVQQNMGQPRHCVCTSNQWVKEKNDLFELDLLDWEEFTDCVRWRHMMS